MKTIFKYMIFGYGVAFIVALIAHCFAPSDISIWLVTFTLLAGVSIGITTSVSVGEVSE